MAVAWPCCPCVKHHLTLPPAASVWMPPPMTEPVCDWKPRPVALTTPEVSVRSNPNCGGRGGQGRQDM